MNRMILLCMCFIAAFMSCKETQETTVKDEQALIAEIAASPEFVSMMSIRFIPESKEAHTPAEIAANRQQREKEKPMFDAYGAILTQHRDELARSTDELSYVNNFKSIILASNYDDATKQYLIKRVEENSNTWKRKTDMMNALVAKYPEVKDRVFREKLFSYYRNAQKAGILENDF